MKRTLNYIDTTLIVGASIINFILLLSSVFISDGLSLVALAQLFIGAYTMLISAPINLAYSKSKIQNNKRLKHFFCSLLYLVCVFPLSFIFSESIIQFLLIVIIPQVLLFYYCSFYFNFSKHLSNTIQITK